MANSDALLQLWSLPDGADVGDTALAGLSPCANAERELELRGKYTHASSTVEVAPNLPPAALTLRYTPVAVLSGST
eukprot:COSAG02_NODE_29708_length_564_cov_1.320430_1_plen_75_part_10